PGHAGPAYGKDASALLVVRGRLQYRGDCRYPPRLLPRHPAQPSCKGGTAGRRVRDPGYLRALADDHERGRVLSPAASQAPSQDRRGPAWPRSAAGAAAAGRSNQRIAHDLVVTLDTVKAHVTHVLGKPGPKAPAIQAALSLAAGDTAWAARLVERHVETLLGR